MDNARALRKELRPLVDAMVPCVARLCLHLAGAAVLGQAEVDRLTKMLRLFTEALDAVPKEQERPIHE